MEWKVIYMSSDGKVQLSQTTYPSRAAAAAVVNVSRLRPVVRQSWNSAYIVYASGGK